VSLNTAAKRMILAKILRDEALSEYLVKNRCVDDYVVARIVELFGEQGIVSLRNFGKGYSRLYKIRLGLESNSYMHLFTFQGKHGEYIILPYSGYCGCYTRFPLNITRRYPCYHLISFSLDLTTDSIVSFDYIAEDIESLIVDLFYESLVKE